MPDTKPAAVKDSNTKTACGLEGAARADAPQQLGLSGAFVGGVCRFRRRGAFRIGVATMCRADQLESRRKRNFEPPEASAFTRPAKRVQSPEAVVANSPLPAPAANRGVWRARTPLDRSATLVIGVRVAQPVRCDRLVQRVCRPHVASFQTVAGYGTHRYRVPGTCFTNNILYILRYYRSVSGTRVPGTTVYCCTARPVQVVEAYRVPGSPLRINTGYPGYYGSPFPLEDSI